MRRVDNSSKVHLTWFVSNVSTVHDNDTESRKLVTIWLFSITIVGKLSEINSTFITIMRSR